MVNYGGGRSQDEESLIGSADFLMDKLSSGSILEVNLPCMIFSESEKKLVFCSPRRFSVYMDFIENTGTSCHMEATFVLSERA